MLATGEYTPWRVLDRKGDKILVQWRGYSRATASWEDATDFPQLTTGQGHPSAPPSLA